MKFLIASLSVLAVACVVSAQCPSGTCPTARTSFQVRQVVPIPMPMAGPGVVTVPVKAAPVALAVPHPFSNLRAWLAKHRPHLLARAGGC